MGKDQEADMKLVLVELSQAYTQGLLLFTFNCLHHSYIPFILHL